MTVATWIAALATLATAVFAGLIYLRQTRGSVLSARFESSSGFQGVDTGTNPQYHLIVRNQGPEAARVISIEVQDYPELLIGEPGLDDLNLLRDEEHRILAAPTLAIPRLVRVKTVWIDSRGEHSREQTLTV